MRKFWSNPSKVRNKNKQVEELVSLGSIVGWLLANRQPLNQEINNNEIKNEEIMTLKNYINTKLNEAGRPTHEHRLSFEGGQQTIVFCSNPNAITVDPTGNLTFNGNVTAGNLTIGGGGGGMIVNGDISLGDNYPPTPNCGRVNGVQYIGNRGGDLNEIQQMLNIVQQIQYQNDYITSYNQQASSYNQQAARYTSDLNSLNAKNTDMQSKIAAIESNISAGGIDKLVNTYSPAQLAHVLSKVWLKSDVLSNNLKKLITAKNFDANHYTPLNSSLLEIAIDQKDATLFKLLIQNGLNLNAQLPSGELVFSKVMLSQEVPLISYMLDHDNSLTAQKAIFSSTFNGNIAQIDQALSIKPSLAVTLEQHGLTLLQYAIRCHQYEIAENIIQKNQDAKSTVNSGGINALEFALNSNDEEALKLLAKYETAYNNTLQECINKNKISGIKLLLKHFHATELPLVDENGNNILHLAAKAQDKELIELCLTKDHKLLNLLNKQEQTALQYAQRQNVEDMTVLELLIDDHEVFSNQDINDIHLAGLDIGAGDNIDHL